MPIAIGPEDAGDKPVLPGKKDSFERSQGRGDDVDATKKNSAGNQAKAPKITPKTSELAAVRLGLLQGDPDDQNVVKPPFGN